MKADRYLLPLLPVAFVFACALVAEHEHRARERAHTPRVPEVASGR